MRCGSQGGADVVSDVVHYGFAAVAVGFALAFLVLVGLTLYAATSMPRISFAESYGTDPDATEPDSSGNEEGITT